MPPSKSKKRFSSSARVTEDYNSDNGFIVSEGEEDTQQPRNKKLKVSVKEEKKTGHKGEVENMLGSLKAAANGEEYWEVCLAWR